VRDEKCKKGEKTFMGFFFFISLAAVSSGIGKEVLILPSPRVEAGYEKVETEECVRQNRSSAADSQRCAVCRKETIAPGGFPI